MLLDELQQRQHLGGQVALAAAVAQFALPSAKFVILAFHARERLGVVGVTVEQASVESVAGADAQRVEVVEHVEFGERDVGERVHAHGMAQHHEVEPSRTTATTGDGAKFTTDVDHAIGHLAVHLGRKRAGANARGVRLGDADHAGDVARADAAARARAAGGRVRRRDERIRAVVDVEERGLCTLEQDRRVVIERIVQHVDGVGKIRRESFRKVVVLRDDRIDVEERFVQRGEHGVFLCGAFFDDRAEPLAVAHLPRAHSDALHLVGISGADAFQRRADLGVAAQRLADRILALVPRKDEMRERRHA